MNIQFQNDRPGYTYIPDVIDEVTGERVDGSGTLAQSHIANLVKEDLNFDGQSPETYEDVTPLTEEELIEADADYIPEQVSPIELASISDEIHSTTFTPNPELATAVASVDLGDSAADVTVQFLSHKVYQGDITAEEAFNEAISSGIPPEALASSYRRLQSFFNN